MLRNVLEKIRPSKEEKNKMKNFAERVLKISKIILKESAKPLLCGSVAKGTWISNKNELDLFLLFSPATSRKDLEKKGLDFAKNIIKKLKGKYEIAYAEHPYLRGWVGKYQIDIVPCYSIEDPEKIKSAVDRTPHHVKYVINNLKNPDEVMLLKQFCEANECYGADVKTQGFSGYLCELLIIYYKSFENCIKKASKWRAGTLITFDKIDKEFALKKFRTPLITIDPVDKNRNVAAAVSIETFYRFVKACNDFLKNKKMKFFFPEKIKPYSIQEISKEIKKRGTRWYLIKFKRPDVIDDTLYPQLRRCIKSLEKILKENGFRVFRKDFWCNDICVLVFEMDIWQVPKISKHIGPNVFSRHAEEFLKHYKQYRIFIDGENWVVEKERKFQTVLPLLKNLIRRSNKELLESGIPNKIVSQFRKARVYSGGESVKVISKLPKEFKVFMRKWFEKDLNVI
ncbi:MAG: CCA tRNA nucleotidyltransferase [Candidatus Aenigmatarchaeota archaeon]